MPDRVDHLLRSIDLTTQRGLELGPLANPVVRREHGGIEYLDHLDTDALRERYGSHDGFDVDAIVPIDHVIAVDGDRSIRASVGPDASFDYVIASHVIEHVPDLVGWLIDIRSVMRDDGLVSLAIPDHRRCFDALRQPTVAGQVVDAHLRRATAPSPGQTFDHFASAVAWRGLIAWGEEPPFEEMVAIHSQEEALDLARASLDAGGQTDVHCWVFTPRSFCRVMTTLHRLGLVPFTVESCTDSVYGEFFAQLRVWNGPGLSGSPAPVMGHGSPQASETAVVRGELAQARAELAAVTGQLDATLGTRSWQVTRPLRSLNGLVAATRRHHPR